MARERLESPEEIPRTRRTPIFEVSCALPPGPAFAELAALAESLGFARVWIFDSAPLYEDPFVHLALAASSTRGIGLATAVAIPTQRCPMTMASSIATLARLAPDRLRIGFGSGFTARRAMGQAAMKHDRLFEYVTRVRRLLAGETVRIDGRAARMLHWPGMTAERPARVPIWLSVFGPRGNARAAEIADGTIGPVHPILPSATMLAGTVLEAGEDPNAQRVKEAIGPWLVLRAHGAYARGGAAAVDAIPGGRAWRVALEVLAPSDERHLLTFEGHVTHLADRDAPLLEAVDVRALMHVPAGDARSLVVGEAESVANELARTRALGYREVLYTPSGPDVARELRAFARAFREPEGE